MTRFAITAMTTLALALSTAAQAEPDRMIAYVPSHSDAEGARAIYTQIIGLLESMTPNQSLTVIQGPNGSEVFDVATPNDMPNHPAWRREFFGRSVAALQNYSSQAFQRGSAQGAPEPGNQVGLHDVISSLPRRAFEAPEVLIFGSARDNTVDDPDHNTLSRFPNDAFLNVPVEQSRFGAAGLIDTLDGMRVHVCLIDDGYVDPRHPDMLERFTALRLDAMGGVLASWTQDLHECVRRAATGRQDGLREFTRNPTDQTPGYYEIENVVLTAPVDLMHQLELLDEMPISGNARRNMAGDLETGAVQLVAVYLYDTDAEDGDIVEIRADGFSFRVPLTNEPRRVVLPIQQGHVTMVGIRDGNGGITVGIETEDGSRSLTPVMQVGEVVDVAFFTR